MRWTSLCRQGGVRHKTNKMARRKRGAKKIRKANAQQTTLVRKVVAKGMDSMARAYARLLVDPCNAPLAYPVYGGADGSYLVRCESIFNFMQSDNNLNTDGVFSWVPGAMGGPESTNYGILAGAGPKGSNFTMNPLGYLCPGYYFIKNNASSFRPVAACMTVMYPGKEVDRAGIVAYGSVHGGYVAERYLNDNAATFQSSEIIAGMPNSEKTPAAALEIVWRPSDNDWNWHDPDRIASGDILNRRGALVLAASGVPAGVTLTLKLTAVYEFKPKYGTGIVQATKGARSTNTLTEVLGFIDRLSGNPWVRSATNLALAGLAGYGRTNLRRITWHNEL